MQSFKKTKKVLKSMNRRTFLQKTTNWTIGSFIGYSVSLHVFPLLSSLEDRLRAYESGDTIEHRVTPIQIKGWRLLFPLFSVKDYPKINPDETIEFILHNSGNKNYHDLSLIGNSVKGSLGVLIDDKLYYELLAFPDVNRQPYLIIREGKNNIITSSKVFPINFYYDTYSPLFGNPRVYSEIPIDKAILKRIHEISESFDAFSNPLSIYIYRFDGDEVMQGYHLSGFDYNRIHSNHFLKPRFEDDGVLGIFHELAHGIMSDKILSNKEQYSNQTLMKAYNRLRKASEVYIGETPEDEFIITPLSPYFNIFTESSYVGHLAKKEVRAGHPWDNHNELFASALSVFRFFPYEFMHRYAELDEQKQDLIGKACKAVFGVLEFVNLNKKDLTRLLPKYEELKSFI